jgi:hypothetical protein
MVFLDLRFLQQQLKLCGGFVYIISLLTFESSIERRKTLVENHTTPFVSEIHTKQSRLFMNSILQKGKNLKSEKSQKYAQKSQRN